MIKPLTSKDAPTLQGLRLQSRQTDPTCFISTLEHESSLSPTHFQNIITHSTSPPSFAVYGFFNPRLIASVQFTRELLPKTQHLANLYELYVHPKHRSQNIAHDLLQHVIRNAKQNPDLEQLHLRVNSSNTKAINLYKKLGFTHFATRKKAIRESLESYQDEFFLNLYL